MAVLRKTNTLLTLDRQQGLIVQRSGLFREKLMARADTDLTIDTDATVNKDLKIPLPANAAYEVWATMIFTGADTTADLKIGWDPPNADSTGRWGQSSTWEAVATGASPPALTDINTTLAFGTAAVTFGFRLLLVMTTITPGDLSIQWSQNTSTASNLTRKVGSFIIGMRTD